MPPPLGIGLDTWTFCHTLSPAVLDEGTGPGRRGPGEAGPGGRTPLGVVVSIVPAVQLAYRPATVSHRPNEAGLWLLGQLISRGLFVLHTLMLFNSKFLIKWKVLLEAREQQLQQDLVRSTALDLRSTHEEGGWHSFGGAHLIMPGLMGGGGVGLAVTPSFCHLGA